MIDSLLHLTVSKPDIIFNVYLCAHFQISPKKSHLHAVKIIIRYVKSKLDYEWYYSNNACFDLLSYSDADFAGSEVDYKSTSEICQFLRYYLVS